MYFLIDQIATLTDQRDREALNMTLARVLMELLKPDQITLYFVMSDSSEHRLLPAVVLKQGQDIEVNNALHADFSQLPEVKSGTPSKRCLEEGQAIVTPNPDPAQGGCVTSLPLFPGQEISDNGVIEIRARDKCDDKAQAVIDRVLRVYRNMHSMFMYSERDALTGLLNRKSFEETFYKTMQVDLSPPVDHAADGAAHPEGAPRRRIRLGEQFWLAMVDVDHFKQVNDRFGHQIGDEVLILVARILKNSFRGYDSVYRFGGEEFVVLLRCPDHEAAVKTAERFRLKMEEYQFPQIGKITASVGLSAIQSGDAPEVVCHRADQAVYFAKRNGRNRVCSYTDLQQQGLLDADVRDGGVELF